MAEEFFTDGLTLFSEPESLIMQELKDPRMYNDLISAMADGKARASEISDRAGIRDPYIYGHLTDLIDLGYVEKVEPFNDEKSKHPLYVISDNLFRFRYYIALNKRRRIASDNIGRTAENIENEMPEYMGRVFEDICREFVRRIGYPVTGRWWGNVGKKTGEIDVVGATAADGKRIGILGTCKFRNRDTEADVLDTLLEYADHVKGFDVKNYAVFSRSGFTDALEAKAGAVKADLVSLDDMYDAEFIAKMRLKHVV
jgi:hypothetical protein